MYFCVLYTCTMSTGRYSTRKLHNDFQYAHVSMPSLE